MRIYTITAGHPALQQQCIICNRTFAIDDKVTLVNPIPEDEDERDKAKAGRPYIAVCDVVHVDCWSQ